MLAICEHYPDIPMDKALPKEDAVKPLRVLLADDQEEVLQTIAEIVSEKFQVVGMAENGRRALELTYLLSPDIVLLDFSMPVMNGLDAASHLKKAGSSAKIVFLTVHDDPSFVEAALSAGGTGYVLKMCLATDLIPSILKVMEGGIFISESIHSEKAPQFTLKL
jgi:DNA-binding NarL/FixJ family response regulator